MSDRKIITQGLTKAAVGHWVKKRFGVNTEVGVIPWGKRKVDVIAIAMNGFIVIAEIKSGYADLKSDTKLLDYLPFCNQMILVVMESFWESHTDYIRERAGKDIGIMVLKRTTGHLKAVKKAPVRKMSGKNKKTIVLRLAWRGAAFSKRNTHRTRVFIEE